MMATLLLSHGVPMILSGDECRRTQLGNNNAWCQDNSMSWFDWRLVERNAELVRFVSELIAFRKREPTVRRTTFMKGEPRRPGELPDVSWFGAKAGPSIGRPKPEPHLSLRRGLRRQRGAAWERLDDPLSLGPFAEVVRHSASGAIARLVAVHQHRGGDSR